MIRKISTKYLTSKEFFQFLSLIIGIADKADVAKSKIKAERDRLNALMPDLQNALSAELANEETQKLIAADKRRDIAISALVAYIKALLKSPTPKKREAAITLTNYLKVFGNDIAGENFAAESTTLSTIVKDCKLRAELSAAIIAIDATDWITEIDIANTEFINLFKSRTTSLSEDKKVKSFTSLRTPAKKAYDELVDIVFSRYKTAVADNQDTTALEACINDMNSTIDQYKTLIVATAT